MKQFKIKFPALLALSLSAGCIDNDPGDTLAAQDPFESDDPTLDESAVLDGAEDVGELSLAPPTTLQACVASMPSSCLNVTSKWTVKVRTADIEYAGTDARISFSVTYRKPDGTTGYTSAIRIDNSFDNFERNQVDTFEVPFVNYGTPTSIQLHSDYSGNNPGWYPTKVSITDRCSGRSWSGFFQGWIIRYSPETPLACGT